MQKDLLLEENFSMNVIWNNIPTPTFINLTWREKLHKTRYINDVKIWTAKPSEPKLH